MNGLTCWVKTWLILTGVVILLNTIPAQISGTVTDAKTGSGLSGAAVSVKGGTEKTITDPEGNFTITAQTRISRPVIKGGKYTFPGDIKYSISAISGTRLFNNISAQQAK